MMSRSIHWMGAAALLLLAGTATTWADGPELKNLENVDQLREAFNQDAGSQRIVLLMSPT